MMNKAHIVFAGSTFSSLMDEIALAADHSLTAAGWQVGKVDLADRPPAWRDSMPVWDAEQEATAVLGSDLLVLVFPMLWCAAPASLKQWIERVFSQELVCQGRPMNSRRRMRGRSAIVVAALEDPDSIPRYDSIEVAMSDMLRPLLEGTLAYLGFTVLRPHFIAGMGQVSGQEATRLLNTVTDVFSHIERRPCFHGLLKPDDSRIHLSML